MKLGLLFSIGAAAAVLAVGCSSSSSSGSSNPGGGGGSGQTGDGSDAGSSSGSRDGGGSSSGKDAGSTTPTTYSHVLINFDDLASSASITNQYAVHATFSSPTSGCASQAIDNYDFGQSPPNYVTTYFSCDTGDTAPVTITFAKPVKNITLSGIGVNGSGKVATFTIKHSDGKTETADWNGAGDPMTPEPVDLTKFADVTELDVTDITDAYGVGYDDLAFDFPDK